MEIASLHPAGRTIEFLLRKESSNSLAMATIGMRETRPYADSDANYTPTFVLSGDKHVFVLVINPRAAVAPAFLASSARRGSASFGALRVSRNLRERPIRPGPRV